MKNECRLTEETIHDLSNELASLKEKLSTKKIQAQYLECDLKARIVELEMCRQELIAAKSCIVELTDLCRQFAYGTCDDFDNAEAKLSDLLKTKETND